MKRFLTALTLCLFSMAAVAQHGAHSLTHGKVHNPPPVRFTVNFESHHGEAFSVFIDGNLMNRMPQTRVMVKDVSDQTHEVVVVMRRPAEKAAVLMLRPGEASVLVNVNYDQRLDQLSLYTPAHNRPDIHPNPHPVVQPLVVPTPAAYRATPAPPAVRITTDDELADMEQRMRNQPFDSERLALGKVIVASASLTADQIARLARTIDYSASQVDFLKYAYHYCVDRKNYYKTVDILSFSSDKKKVLDYIATQR